jgi:hypothetical protein
LSSPLIAQFRRGDMPLDVRLLAAEGGLVDDGMEQIELLALLLGDSETAVVERAERTLEQIPTEVLAAFVARPDATSETREALAKRGIEPGHEPAPDDAPPPVAPEDDASGPDLTESRPQMLALMPVIDKIKIALRGTREQRGVLVRDPNKVVAVAVLGSPKLNVTEIEAYARMSSVKEEVLRIIGSSRHWIKHYPVAVGLVGNPKTPLALSMPLVVRLNERDLKLLARDRNVADGLRAAARKFLLTGQARRR